VWAGLALSGPWCRPWQHRPLARWLAGQVAPNGGVLATDIDTRFLASSASAALEVRQHDLLQDSLEPDRYDLVHCRSVLAHLVGRQQQAVDRLAGAVRMGGWLALEETETTRLGSADPSHPAHQTADEAFAAGRDSVKEHVDLHCGRHVAGLVIRHPELRVVNIDVSATMQSGGSPHARFVAETFGAVLSAQGPGGVITNQTIQVVADALGDPSFSYVTEMRYRMLAQRVGTDT